MKYEGGTKPLGRGAEDCDEVAARQGGTVRREADAVNDEGRNLAFLPPFFALLGFVFGPVVHG